MSVDIDKARLERAEQKLAEMMLRRLGELKALRGEYMSRRVADNLVRVIAMLEERYERRQQHESA